MSDVEESECDRKILISIYTTQKRMEKNIDFLLTDVALNRSNVSSLRKDFTYFKKQARKIYDGNRKN